LRLGPSELLARPGRFLPLCGDVLEFLAGCLKDGLQSADRMKPPKDHITIKRVELDAKTAAPSPLGSDQRRARAGKGIENDAFTARAVAYRVCNHRHRFHGGVKLEIRAAIPEAVDARIGPDIRAVAAVFAEFDVVGVRCVPGLEDANEFVLRAIERPHAGVGRPAPKRGLLKGRPRGPR
jgi:hypothetical protein